MPSFAALLKDQIKQGVDIVQVIGDHLELQRAGRLYKALCPFHDDHRPSLMIDPDRQTFKCYPCGKGGDVISFVQEIERVDFSEALRLLAERAGISIAPSEGPPPKNDKPRLYQVMAWAEKQFHACLLRDPAAEPARRYLQERDINEACIRSFALGYHPEDWQWVLRRGGAKRFSPADLERVGLIKPRERGGYQDEFVGRLMFPIRDMRGRAVAFGGRLLPGSSSKSTAKYKNSTETPLFTKREILYGFDLARQAVVKSGTAVLVEGYTDCIVAHQFGMSNVVAPLGTALTEQHVQVLKRHAKQVILVFDGDEAGRKAAERALELFIGHDMDVRICTLEGGKDPCDVLRNEGSDVLQRYLTQSPDVLEYMLGCLQREFDLASTHGRHQAAEEFARLIARAPRVGPGYESRRRMREWIVIDKVSQRLKIPEGTLRETIAQARQKTPAARRQSSPPVPVYRFDPVERELLEVVLQDPSNVDEVRREVPLDLLSDSPLRTLLAQCFELAAQGVRASFSRLTSDLEDVELKRLATDLEAEGRRNGNVQSRLEAVLAQIRIRGEARRARELQEQLRQSSPDLKEGMDLLRQLDQSKRVQQRII